MNGPKQECLMDAQKRITKELDHFNRLCEFFDELIARSAHKKWRKTQSRFLSLRRWLTRTIPARQGH
jgi:hypothetical protein